jgi:hypothetical protein
MHIKFIYPKGIVDINKNKLVQKVCTNFIEHLELPDEIVIEFQYLPFSTYAETMLDHKRVIINLHLDLNDIVIPLVHELIHLHQLHKGQLAMSKKGEYVWEGAVYRVNPAKMLYSEYNKLPWELDVAKKQQKILGNILKNQ